MRLGAENRKKVIAAVIFASIAILLFFYEVYPFYFASQPVGRRPAAARNLNQHPRGNERRGFRLPTNLPLDPTIRMDLLRAAESQRYHSNRRNIFVAEAPRPPRSVNVATHTSAPLPPSVPVAPQGPPPIPLKFYGWASRGTGQTNSRQIFLSQGDQIYIAKEGDVVANRYKIVHITSNGVQIEDVLNNNTQTIPLS